MERANTKVISSIINHGSKVQQEFCYLSTSVTESRILTAETCTSHIKRKCTSNGPSTLASSRLRGLHARYFLVFESYIFIDQNPVTSGKSFFGSVSQTVFFSGAKQQAEIPSVFIRAARRNVHLIVFKRYYYRAANRIKPLVVRSTNGIVIEIYLCITILKYI